MQFEKINNKGQAQLFNSKPLESLTKCNPWAIFILYLPIIAFLPIYTFKYEFFSAGRVVSLFVAGTFFWTFTEYILHRFAFHHDAISSWVRKLIYLFHGNHHEYPRDKERLLMPVVPSLFISSLFLFVFYLFVNCIPGIFVMSLRTSYENRRVDSNASIRLRQPPIKKRVSLPPFLCYCWFTINQRPFLKPFAPFTTSATCNKHWFIGNMVMQNIFF